jgi:hypothetical protein
MRGKLLLGAAACAVAAYLLLRPGTSQERIPISQSTGSTISRAAHAPTAHANTRLKEPPQDKLAAARPSPSSALLGELSAAADLRAFALSALSRPAEGGHFYARYVAIACGLNFPAIRRMHDDSVAAKLSEHGTISPHQLAAGDNLPRRCASFVGDEVAQILEKVQAHDADGQDPLIAAERQARNALKSKDPAALRQAFAALQQVNDPLLWTQNSLPHTFAASDPEARKSGGIYFDGQVLTHDDPLSFLETRLALNLGFCIPELPCASDYQVQMSCLFDGHCVADRSEWMKAQYFAGGGTDAGWTRVIALQNRIRAALSSGNTSMFVR